MEEKILESSRARLVERRQQLAAVKARLDAQRDLYSLSPDFGELSTNQLMASLSETMDARESAELAEVEAALERMDAGAYGRCTRCARRIADDRLAAHPEVGTCDECALRLERQAQNRRFDEDQRPIGRQPVLGAHEPEASAWSEPPEEPSIEGGDDVERDGLSARPTEKGGALREAPTSLAPEDLGRYAVAEATEMGAHDGPDAPRVDEALQYQPDERLPDRVEQGISEEDEEEAP